MKIGEVLNSVFDEEVGWRPASGSIKPVHVANGLIRSILGRYHDIRRVVEIIAPKSGTDSSLFERLTTEDPAFACFAGDQRSFDRTRKYMHGLLAADRAVFPSADHSSLTLTCSELVSRDYNDRHLGEFLASFLMMDDGRIGPLGRVLRDSLEVERAPDPITALSWPLLDSGPGSEVSRSDSLKKTLTRKHQSEIVQSLHSAARDLATHERVQGNRLRTLERIVLFACAATHAHAQAIAADGVLVKRRPALMAIAGSRNTDLASASEHSINAIYDHFEDWLEKMLALRLKANKPLSGDERLGPISLDGRKMRSVLSSIEPDDRSGVVKRQTLDARMAFFEEARESYTDCTPATAVAHAIVCAYLREYRSGGPREFLQGLCRKAGLLFPHYQGRAREKRVRPSPLMLDVLVRACVPAGQLVPLHEFLDRLWLRFGIVVGGRESRSANDASLLASHAIDIEPSALAENVSTLVEQLEIMGLARSYADNITFVGDSNAS